jgi:hypothetical protein
VYGRVHWHPVADSRPERYDYVRDDARRRIRITVHEPLTAEELIGIVDRQAEEGTWTYGMLYDMRALQHPSAKEDIVTVSSRVQGHIANLGPRGPVALVTRAFGVVGAGQIYAAESQTRGFNVQVFWDVDDAEEWLARPRR